MIFKKTSAIFLLFSCGVMNLFAQSYNHPNFGLKSHETLEIMKVEMAAERTVISLSIENRIDKGEFCADKNIYILYPDGTKLNIINSTGIPRCPDSFKFRKIGEKLSFTLVFPKLKSGTKWFDLIEDCNSNCFSFYGVLLNSEMNSNIDEAVAMVDRGDIDSAIGKYKSIIESTGSSDSGVIGSLYSDLISLQIKKGYKAEAEAWYKKLAGSAAPRLSLYIKNLNSRGIKFN